MSFEAATFAQQTASGSEVYLATFVSARPEVTEPTCVWNQWGQEPLNDKYSQMFVID